MSRGARKTRLTLRLDPPDKDRIKSAATVCGFSFADFVRGAALLRAEEVEGSLSSSCRPYEALEALAADLLRAVAETEGQLTDEG